MQVKKLRKEETKTDKLLQLPESLQLHILSFLDARHAIATSLLSKSWASIWTCIPVLNFSSDGFKEDRKFDNFVVNALSRRQPVKLDRLTYKRARCSPESLKEVFDYACLHGVEELEANITPTSRGHNWPIWSSDSLTKLKLQGRFLSLGCSFLGPKGSVGSFRNLSSLHLDFGTITDIDPFSGFPALQKLRLIWCHVETNGKTLNVHAPQLSEFTSYKTEVYRYEFTTPKLRYFEWEDYNNIPWFSKAHFPVLDTAIINHTGGTYSKEKIHYDYLLMMFNSLQGAKSLTVSANTLHLLSSFLMNSCSPFRDLKCLKLDLRICGYTPFFIETLKLLPIMGDYFLDKSLDAKCTVVTYPNVKSSCVSFQEITITNEKGRLSQEEIEQMVREAEEFAERIGARNALEDYMYNMKNQVSDKDKLADKLESDEKDKIEAATKEALEWLDDKQSAEKEDYDEKLKEVEAVCNSIIAAVYQRTGGPAPESAEEEDEHDEI